MNCTIRRCAGGLCRGPFCEHNWCVCNNSIIAFSEIHFWQQRPSLRVVSCLLTQLWNQDRSQSGSAHQTRDERASGGTRARTEWEGSGTTRGSGRCFMRRAMEMEPKTWEQTTTGSRLMKPWAAGAHWHLCGPDDNLNTGSSERRNVWPARARAGGWSSTVPP